jgi:hypothetical protein
MAMKDGICDGPGECNPEVLLKEFLTHVVLLPSFEHWEQEFLLPHQRNTLFFCLQQCHHCWQDNKA